MSLPGNPTLLESHAEEYLEAATAIRWAAERLRQLAFDSTGRAIEEIEADAATVAAQLDAAYDRYSGTAYALREYAVELADLHHRADAADEDERFHRAHLDAVLQDAETLRRRIAALAAQGAAGMAGQLQEQLDQLEAQAGRILDAIDETRARTAEFARELDVAARRAIALIDTAIEHAADSLLDHLGAAVSSLGSFLAGLADWVEQVFARIVDELQRSMATVVALLSTALLLLVAFVVLAVIAGPGLAGLIIGVLAAFLVGSILSDVLKPTPAVTVYPASTPGHSPGGTQPAGVGTVLSETMVVDGMGERIGGDADETVIKITRIVDADGPVRWRVALPSTQEWLSRFGGDAGGTNDLDSNLALMMTPSMRTQYERAVLEAMRQAGVGPDDPVMLVGFSQGGIMAGTLAAYNSDYTWSAVVVSGAPIDHMPIPATTTVVSVQHIGDPVPMLDTMVTAAGSGYGGYGLPRNNEHWMTIRDDVPAATSVEDVHNADQYSLTLQHHEQEVVSAHPELADFIPSPGSDGGGYSTETFYSWQE